MPPQPMHFTCGDAVFATDADGMIVSWNDAAARLCGRPAPDALGRPCHDVIRGIDRFGNRYCDSECPVLRMARRGEPVREFAIDVAGAAGHCIPVHVSLLVVTNDGVRAPTIVHVLRPVPAEGPAGTALGRPTASEARAEAEARAAETELLATLSAREREVLRHLSEGESSGRIAEELFISEATVRHHIQSILTKLGVHSRLEAVCMAVREAAPKNSKHAPGP